MCFLTSLTFHHLVSLHDSRLSLVAVAMISDICSILPLGSNENDFDFTKEPDKQVSCCCCRPRAHDENNSATLVVVAALNYPINICTGGSSLGNIVVATTTPRVTKNIFSFYHSHLSVIDAVSIKQYHQLQHHQHQQSTKPSHCSYVFTYIIFFFQLPKPRYNNDISNV